MSTQVGRVMRIGGGVVLLILGVIGLFVPVLQGILFIGMGLTLLSRDSDRARDLLEWLKAKFPHHRHAAEPSKEE